MTQIQIPSGMRDLTNDACVAKDALRNRITEIYKSYGYRPVETPLIEFYSTYQNTFTSLKEETLYKFVDESGQLLVLRTDMTLPIARLTAGKYSQDEFPLRFCYCSNVYKVRQSFAGKRNEVTDCEDGGNSRIFFQQKSGFFIPVPAKPSKTTSPGWV